MNKYSLQRLRGKYRYFINGEEHFGYGLCSNVSVAECEAQSLNEAIEKLKGFAPVPLNEDGYGQNDVLSYIVCEII